MKASFIILLLTLIITGILFLLVLFLKEQKSTVPPTKKTQQPLSVVSYSPKDSAVEYLPVQQVAISFNQPVNPDSVKITTTPLTETAVRQGSDASTIIVSAKPAWKNGTTTIEVLSEDKPIIPPFVYQLKTGFPPAAPPDAKGI